MKRFKYVWALLLAATVLHGETLKVGTTLPPYGWLVEQIGGEQVEVEVLLADGKDPHDFLPTPKQMMAFGRKSLVFMGKMPFEEKLTGMLKDSKSVTMTVFDEHLELLKVEQKSACTACAHGHQHHHTAGEMVVDRHIWLGLTNLATMGELVRDALVKAQPSQRATFEKAHVAFNKRLTEVKKAAESKAKTLKRRTFYVFHPAFGYYAHDLNLTQSAVEVNGREPSPKQLFDIIKSARKDRARVVVIQRQFERGAAEKVAKAIGAEVLEVDPLAPDVLSTIEALTAVIAKNEGQ